MTTSRRRLLAAAAGVLVAGTLAGSGRGAFAQPLPPPPPPNPSDDQLSRSRAGVVAVDQELGALRASLATATAALEAAQIELARTLDVADRAITKRDTARAAADAAQVAATAAKDGQKVADSLVEQRRSSSTSSWDPATGRAAWPVPPPDISGPPTPRMCSTALSC